MSARQPSSAGFCGFLLVSRRQTSTFSLSRQSSSVSVSVSVSVSHHEANQANDEQASARRASIASTVNSEAQRAPDAPTGEVGGHFMQPLTDVNFLLVCTCLSAWDFLSCFACAAFWPQWHQPVDPDRIVCTCCVPGTREVYGQVRANSACNFDRSLKCVEQRWVLCVAWVVVSNGACALCPLIMV